MQLGRSNYNHDRNTPPAITTKESLSNGDIQRRIRRRRRNTAYCLPVRTNTFIFQFVIIISLNLFLLSSSFVLPLTTTITSRNQNPLLSPNYRFNAVSTCIMGGTKTGTNDNTSQVKIKKKKVVAAPKPDKRYIDDNAMAKILNGDVDDEDYEEVVPATNPKTSPTATTTKKKKKKKLDSSFSKTVKHFNTLTSSGSISNNRVVHANVKETGKDTMSQYFKSIGNHELLRHEDEIVLGKQIQVLVKWEEIRCELEDSLLREPSVDEWAQAVNQTSISLKKQIKRSQRAKTALIEANLRLVITIARQNLKHANAQSKAINFQDACQDGIIGLIKACEKYDPAQGFRFSTYAHWWIKRQIQQNLMQQTSNNKRAYNLPYHVLRKINQMKIMEVTLREESRGKVPSDQLLASKLETTVEKLNYYRKLSQEAISLDKQLSIRQGKGSAASSPGTTSSTFMDVIPDKENMSPTEDTDKQMLQHDIRRLVGTLSPREQAVIRLRFGLMTDDGTPKTLESIAKRFKVSTDNIRMIETSALEKLKQPYRSSSLKCYISDYV